MAVALLGLSATPIALILGSSPAGASTSTYTPTTGTGDHHGPAGCTGYGCAPWNLSQGDSASTAYPESDLSPSYVPGGRHDDRGTTEPNIAVYPSRQQRNRRRSAYPSGVVGTQGRSTATAARAIRPVTRPLSTRSRQPAGTTLPLAPAVLPPCGEER